MFFCTSNELVSPPETVLWCVDVVYTVGWEMTTCFQSVRILS